MTITISLQLPGEPDGARVKFVKWTVNDISNVRHCQCRFELDSLC